MPSSINAEASVNAEAEIIATAKNAMPNVIGNVFNETCEDVIRI